MQCAIVAQVLTYCFPAIPIDRRTGFEVLTPKPKATSDLRPEKHHAFPGDLWLPRNEAAYPPNILLYAHILFLLRNASHVQSPFFLFDPSVAVASNGRCVVTGCAP